VAPKKAPVWPYVAAGAVVVLGAGAVLAFRQAPPPVESVKERVVFKEVEKAPAKAEGPKDDPKKVLAASNLYSTAEQLVKQEKWKEALVSLHHLNKDFESLHYTQEHAAEIGKLISACELGLRGAESAKSKQVEDARQARRDGRWAEALPAFQELVKAGHAEFQADLDSCRREVEAMATLKEIEAARDAARWPEVGLKIAVLFRQHQQAKIESVEKRAADLVAMAAKAKEENDTAKLVADSHAAAQAGSWKLVQQNLVTLETHRDTDTYKMKESDIRDLRFKYAQANEAAADDEAGRAWTLTMKAYVDALGEKKYDEATDVMEEYRQRHGASRVGRSREPDINLKIADAVKKRQIDRNDEAKKLLPLAKKEISASNFEAAAEYVAKLTGDLADTEYVKSNLSQIKGYKKICDERARQPAHILVEMDFEDFPGLWQLRGGATGGNTFEEPQQGRRSARLTLPSSARASHPLNGMGPKAESISFWARVRGKSSPTGMEILLHDETGMVTLTYGLEVTLTQEWKQQKFSFSEFKPINPAAKGTLIVPARISAFTLESSSGSANQILELQLDTLRVEGARAQK
jgi:hypothetical protein